ncbi:putative UDP-rhamnose:rhamnosyltransferase 1 [Senna tora]|uniref:Putative UDP-rhamnose:rhamnosyltransferase 1 n=1 Tax=Senna tora TaxID=362788 RepID=A0A834WNS7_9FABA|nr:putative UDP-rhamnose:rhamnosyltransferase 1 [Senna tora]
MPELQNGDLAYDLLQYPFQKLVEDESPDWIIIDFMPCKTTPNSSIALNKWTDEFVGFGSECKEELGFMRYIAYGLELSEFPFLWSLRELD